MRIDGLNLDLRERNAWEAFDLGVALARTTGARLFVPYGVVFVVLALLVHLATWGHPLIAFFVLWWLKPMADRVALAVLGQAVFGAAPGWRSTLGSLLKIPRSGWLMSFTLGRLDFARSFHLPVRQLEGQTGKAGRERIRVLDKKLRSHAFWLTVAMWHFVFILVYGLNGLVNMLAPEGMHAGFDFASIFGASSDESLAGQYLFNAALVLAECVIEPIYISAGFALYLSRRTALEGWDLEVAFKRLSARIEEQQATVVIPGLLAFVLAGVLLAGGTLAPPAQAEQHPQSGAQSEGSPQGDPPVNPAPAEGQAESSEGQATPAGDQAAPAEEKAATAPAKVSREKTAIMQVLAAPEFQEFVDEPTWKYRGKPDKPGKPFEMPKFGEGWFTFMQFLGELLRALIWVVAIAALGWLLYLLSRHMGWFKGAFKFDRVKPDVMFGMDLRPESLPDDIPAAARALLVGGDMRAALALLYRGALSVLVHERDVEVRTGDTEEDCVRRVAKAGPPALATYFQSLVSAWGLIAYAGRRPERAEAERLISAWAGHFTPAPAAPAAPDLKAALA